MKGKGRKCCVCRRDTAYPFCRACRVARQPRDTVPMYVRTSFGTWKV